MNLDLKQTFYVFFALLSISLMEAQEPNPLKALSLARIKKNGRTHIVQVNKIDDEYIEGINLSEQFNRYPIAIFELVEEVGYDQILEKISQGNIIRVRSSDVLPPVDALNNTIAAATNYPEHKEETHVEIDPVLFPKIAQLTPYISTVKTKSAYLLDYEVELGFVYSKDVKKREDLENQLLGFMVVMDYSDRESQLREYDTSHPELAVGFTNSKSHEGFFPVGPILVIPRKWQDYYKDLELKLWRGTELKQNDSPKNLYWDISKITEETLKFGNKEIWTLRDKPISLLPKNYIEKGTIVITGTPGGVIFTTPTKGYIIKKAIKYSLLFKYFKWNPKEYVVDQFIKKLRKEDDYLKDGEKIYAQISNLGYIKSQVVSE
ncbi:fumarylacetoacetate hydrolase family protein [Flavobacterium sp. J27]|uniref:fumarylacetoacetate hydrolase family protein n=1 Tax=Flavobacterium sp. J27 TaxID=2060419 RepID=UPI00102F5905|nr:fumarylacetoacetate hydrolase family protein [Flavobacterium sp. J27]